MTTPPGTHPLPGIRQVSKGGPSSTPGVNKGPFLSPVPPAAGWGWAGRRAAERSGGARGARCRRPARARGRAGRGTPDRGAARRRSRLVPDTGRRAVRAGPGRAGRHRGPTAHLRLSLHHPDQPGHPGHRRALRRARRARLHPARTGHRPGAQPHRVGRRSATVALAAGHHAAGAGPGRGGGGDRGEPPGVRRQRPDRGREPGRRLPGRGRHRRTGRPDAARPWSPGPVPPWSPATTRTSTGTATSAAWTRCPGGRPWPRWTRC